MKEIIKKALSKGVEMHVAGQFDLAGQLYETVLKLQPDHADANHNMGLLKLDIGDDLEALPYLQTALQADISVAQFWLSYTKALIKLEKFDEVARILDLAKENGIEGEEFLESNQLVKSVTKSGKAIQAEVDSPSPSDPNILDSLKLNNALRLAEKMAKDGNNEKSKKIYKDIVAKFPKNKRAQKSLTTLNKSQQSNATQGPPQETLNQLINLYDQGHLAAVIEQANTLTRQYPKAIAVWNVLGAAAAQTGQLAQAINAFKKITVIKPDNAQAYNNLGIALQQQGKLEEAVAAYKKALVINPNSANAYNNMGITLKHQGKLDEAIASYNKALALKPNYVEAAKNLVQLPIGSIGEKTISGLNKKSSSICANISDQSEKLFFEANLLSHKGKYDEAFEIFVDANYIKAQNNILTMKAAQIKYDAAIKRVSSWSVNLQPDEKAPVKKLFILGPSRSGKSTLENLLICSPNVFPMFENINLDVTEESERSTGQPQKPSMVDLFYHDENHLFKRGYSLVTSTKPDTVFEIDRLIDIFSNSFCIFVKRNRTDIASEIFTNGYSKGNFDFCDHSSILKYLHTYEAIWEILKLKAPQLTLEISFEDILSEPQETVKKISQLTGVSLEIENPPHQSIKNLHSPFREHYAFRFTAPCCP